MYALIKAVNFGVGGASYFAFISNYEHPIIPIGVLLEWEDADIYYNSFLFFGTLFLL